MERPFHDILKLERTLKAPASRVFDAFRKLELKRRWFTAPSDYQELERSIDFRLGGKEILRGKFPSGLTTSYEATFYDIVEDSRIVYAYDLLHNGQRFSVTLATIELQSEGSTTHLTFTEQNVYLNAPADANESRIRGVSWHLDQLEKLF